MTRTPKINSIITALETIEPTTFEQLCADLMHSGALGGKWKDNLIQVRGSNLVKNTTVPYPVDGIIHMPEGLCVLQCSTQEDWVSKLKDDVKSVKRWAEKQSRQLVGMIFITTRDIGNRQIGRRDEEKLPPEEFIKKELPQFKIQASLFGQKDLLVPLQNSDYFYIRRRRLNIPEDYFLSLDSFKSHHKKQAQDNFIHLKRFVPGTNREANVNALKEFARQTNRRVLLIHAQGGIGKTRFALESLKQIGKQNKNIDILFNKKRKYVNVDEIIPEISADLKSLIVLDDAHLINNLTDFSSILSERNHAKIILISRSTASESVEGAIGYPAEEIELTSLDRDSSIELLKNNLDTPLRDEYLRLAADICEGNPLLIGITAHLINKGEIQSFRDLKKDDLIRDYLKKILADLKQHDGFDQTIYEPYLALLFLLKPFSLNDDEIKSLIKCYVDINKSQERFLLRDLEECGVLEKHGDTLWLYPDLLGEYLVETTFFSDIRILKLDDIFPNIPSSNMKSVFNTLRDLDNSKADLFLKRWSNVLANKVESQNNFELCESLELLEIIVPTVADEALHIVDVLLRPESEKPPSTNEILGLATTTRKYQAVLSRCLRILESHSLRYHHFDDTLERVLRIYFYKPESDEYSVLQKDALKAIVKTAAYNLNLRGYSIQIRMFDKVQEWKQENLETYFTLILHVCGTLLGTEMKSEYSDYEGFSWTSAPVVITDELIRLRRDIISLLQSIFDETQEAERQIEIVRVLNCGTEYPAQSKYSDGMREMIEFNIKAIYEFYLTLATSSSPQEVEVLEEIEQQAHYLKAWRYEDMEVNAVLNQLLTALQADEWYQLFRTLLSGNPLHCRNEDESPEQASSKIDKRIKEIVDTITDENLNEWLETFNRIAEIGARKVHHDFPPFYKLLSGIGKAKPHITRALIDKSLLDKNALKGFVAEFIRGIRASNRPDIAGNYINRWLSGEDQMLILEIPESFWRVDEKFLDPTDVEIFASLLNCRMGDKEQNRKLNTRIMSNIRWIYKQNPAKATEIICQLFRSADQDSIFRYVHELRRAREQIDLRQWELTKFEEILNTFENLPVLNSDVIYILTQYGHKAPHGLIDLFERRVEKQIDHEQTKHDSFSKYEAIPYGPNLREFDDVFQAHPQHSKAINQIMKWFQKDDYRYKHAAANLISGISPELDGTLKETLLNLIGSCDENKLKIVLTVLEKFPDDPALETLCKDAVKYSQGNKKRQDRIEFFILYDLRGRGAIHLKEKLNSWREDENQYVRIFAQKISRSIEAKNESDEKWNAEERIKRKKGLG